VAQKLGLFNQWLWGKWADRSAINKNADALESVEATVSSLQETVAVQAEEILRLRAMILGVVDLLQAKVPIDESELELAMNHAWERLVPPPPPEPPRGPTDPYRNLVASDEATPEEIDAAKALLATAEEHHFAKEFDEARAIYQKIVDRYGATKQAKVARQQLANLRRS